MSSKALSGLTKALALAAALIAPMVSLAAGRWNASPNYHLVKSVPLGTPNTWDYLVYSPMSNRVFVAHGNRLTVIDGGSGRIVGQVGPIPGGPHGIAFDRAANLGITDDGGIGQAVIFNLQSLKVVKRLKVQRGADAVAFDPLSGHAFVIDGRTGDVAVIDPARERVVTFIHLGGDLEYAVAGRSGELYVNGVTHHEIFRINTATNHVDAVLPMPQCRHPHGLAIDTSTHRLFSSCQNQRLVVMDSKSGKVIATLRIGRGTDADRFDPKNGLIFSSNGVDGTLTIIREVNADTFVRVSTVRTWPSARTMAIDPESGRVFLVAARTKSPQAWRAAYTAFMAGRQSKGSPFVPNSTHLLFFDPGH